MNGGTLLWLVIGGCSGCLFFGIAAVVAVRGITELRDLLVHHDQKNDPVQGKR